MSELEIVRWVILTGQIFSIVEPVENRRIYRSRVTNGKSFILTFILTLGFLKNEK
jgi:hypothetical protein